MLGEKSGQEEVHSDTGVRNRATADPHKWITAPFMVLGGV